MREPGETVVERGHRPRRRRVRAAQREARQVDGEEPGPIEDVGGAERQRRERQRGDRRVGDAKRDFFTVHQHAIYDLEVDTTSTSPDSNGARIIAAHAVRTRPSAFDRMAQALETIHKP
ncbi:MAG: hypothetical protein JO266_12910 [Acidobacteria bacterium]|nr:hypothetical protein [Acidobacteriota bacterium]